MTRIGVLGAGQLAKMLSVAAYPLGLSTVCYDPTPDACAKQVANVITADYLNQDTLKDFASKVDVITFETENITAEIFSILADCDKFYPSKNALLIAQDRLLEKQCLNQLGIPTAPFTDINSLESLHAAVTEFGMPCILKTRRGGYDGKGQAVIHLQDDIALAWEQLGNRPLILEGFVPFNTEVSMLAVRGSNGDIKTYPLVENIHKEGILRESYAPFENHHLEKLAIKNMHKLLKHLDYVGVLAIEFFVTKNQLIANEIAPRVHNTGHWTIEGAVTSQFENHMRAIAGFPVGDCSVRGYSCMVNMISEEVAASEVLQMAGAHYHSYGKTARANRKLGHITLCHDNKTQLNLMRKQIRQLIS